MSRIFLQINVAGRSTTGSPPATLVALILYETLSYLLSSQRQPDSHLLECTLCGDRIDWSFAGRARFLTAGR